VSALPYRPEIDGLRALAVVPVILFHAGIEIFGGGYLGVDVFFVISGFLITAILLREMEAGKFSLAKFYERRARRILPALFFVIIVTSIFAWLWMIPPQWEDYTEGLVAMALFATNILFWRKTGYFDTDAELNPLLHTWTLSVEEQFYIAFPLLLLLGFRFGKKWVVAAIVAVAAISLAASEWLSFAQPSANFYLLPSRAWELMAGSICALILQKPDFRLLKIGSNAKQILALVGLVLLIGSIFTFTPQTRSPALITLAPIIGVMLIILYAQSGTIVARILQQKPFVAIGLVSYSAYLWHQPLLVFYRIKSFNQSPFIIASLVAATFALATISYFWVEQPARFKLMKRRSTAAFLTVSAASLLICLVAGLALRYSSHNHLPFAKQIAFQPYAGEEYPWNFSNRNDAENNGQAMMLYGDSHAKQLAAGLDDAMAEDNAPFAFSGEYACIALPGIRSFYRGGVRPVCQSHLPRMLKKLSARKQALVIAQFWGARLIDDGGNAIGTDGAQNDPQALKAVLTGLNSLVKTVGAEQRIIVVGAVPDISISGVQMAEGFYRCKQYWDGQCPETFSKNISPYMAFNAKLSKWAAQYPNVRFVNPFDALCDAETCSVTRGGKSHYFDKGHLTKFGAELIVKDIMRQRR
jgi:peptidoglycan/LPS O-acetylase OafA/YrhL